MSNLASVTSRPLSNENLNKLFGTILKPATNLGVSYLINSYYFSNSDISVLGFELNQRLFYSLINCIISYFQESIKNYVLPEFLEKKLVKEAVYLISPTVTGLGVMLTHEIVSFAKSGQSLSGKALLTSFAIAAISELVAQYIYEYFVSKIMNTYVFN